MKLEMVKLDDIVLDSANAREHPPENQRLLKASLEKFGQRKPIVVAHDNVVIAGNGTAFAAMELGWGEIAVVRAPEDWSQEMIRAFAIADNRSTDLSSFNEKVLSEQLGDLEVMEFDLEAVGFSSAELERLQRVTEASIVDDFDPYKEWTGMPEYRQDDLESKFSCTVHFPDEESRDRFFELLEVEPKKSFWWPESDGLVGSTQQEQYVVDNDS